MNSEPVYRNSKEQRESAEDYIRSRMGRTGINGLLNNQLSVPIATVRHLQELGFVVARDISRVRQRQGIEGISGENWNRICKWHDEKEKEYRSGYYLSIDYKLLTLEGYIKSRLGEVSTSKYLTIFGMSLDTLMHLFHVGIETMGQWRAEVDLNIPARDIVVLNRWLNCLTAHFEEEYRTGKITPINEALANIVKRNHKLLLNRVSDTGA